jgi:hypothetical protein
MLPVTVDGILERVAGCGRARSVPGVTAVDITLSPGSRLVPLPEGDRYLGFVFAKGPTPADVEARLRQATGLLEVRRRPPGAAAAVRRCAR